MRIMTPVFVFCYICDWAAWEIRGFGHVKEATIENVKRREQELLAEFQRRSSTERAAQGGAG